MSKTETRWLLAACVVLGTIGYLAGTQATAPLDEVERGPAEAGAAGQTPSAADARSAMDAAQHGTTGASRTPSAYGELAARARAGDRDAASRLASLLARCADVPSREHFIGVVRQMEATGTHASAHARDGAAPSLSDRVQRMQQALRADRESCAGITSGEIATRAHWLYTAASLGDADAAFKFGEGAFFYPDVLSQLDEVASWRDHAVPMLERALADGNPKAVVPLARDYDPEPESDGNLPSPPAGRDAVKAYAYYTLESTLFDHGRTFTGDALRRLGAGLSDEQRRQAIELAAEICASDLPSADCSAIASQPH